MKFLVTLGFHYGPFEIVVGDVRTERQAIDHAVQFARENGMGPTLSLEVEEL